MGIWGEKIYVYAKHIAAKLRCSRLLCWLIDLLYKLKILKHKAKIKETKKFFKKYAQIQRKRLHQKCNAYCRMHKI